MDYGIFKALQFVLFFGAAFGFGIWQLIALRREPDENQENKGED